MKPISCGSSWGPRPHLQRPDSQLVKPRGRFEKGAAPEVTLLLGCLSAARGADILAVPRIDDAGAGLHLVPYELGADREVTGLAPQALCVIPCPSFVIVFRDYTV
jgi:hypothetical protein